MEDRLNAFVGRAFEPLCRDLVASAFPGRWPEMGLWWGARREKGKRIDVEIDVVGLNAADKEILLGECKWSEGVDAVDMLSDLRVKAGHVQWNRLDRREVYVLFARSFKGRLDEPDVLMYDIDDIREMVENRA